MNIREGDRFSEELLANFRLKNVPLPGLAAARSTQAQIERAEAAGLAVAEVLDMNGVQGRLLERADVARLTLPPLAG